MLKNEQVSSMQNQWQIKVLTQHFSSARDAFTPPLILGYAILILFLEGVALLVTNHYLCLHNNYDKVSLPQ